jgi:hypothetical protein
MSPIATALSCMFSVQVRGVPRPVLLGRSCGGPAGSRPDKTGRGTREIRSLDAHILSALAAILLIAGGAAEAAAGLADVIDQAREKLGPVLLARDLLVEPGTDVALEASLRTGLRLTGIEGKRVQFLQGDELLGETRTNRAGDVALRWKVPAKPGDYLLRVRLNPQDQQEPPIADTELLVSARKADTPLAVVDLDRTVVASNFASVLMGDAKPMAGASLVLERLAKTHTIVYLTHRPDFLGALSRQWLAANHFPSGPVLTSTLGGLMAGSPAYKNARIEAIRQTFKNLAVGIGDKMSDAKVYADNGIKAILILQVDWAGDKAERYEKLALELAGLPDSVQVVTNWSQVADALFNKAVFLKQDMEKRLRDVARDLRARSKD